MSKDALQIFRVSEFSDATDTVMKWVLEEWGPREGEGEQAFRSRVNGEAGNPEAMVAVLSGVPVGAVAFRRYDLLEEATDVLWINALYVLPEHRGLGIRTELVGRIARFAMILSGQIGRIRRIRQI